MNDINITINSVPYFKGLHIVSVDRDSWVSIVITVPKTIVTVDPRLYRVEPTQGVDGKYEALSADIYDTDTVEYSVSSKTITIKFNVYEISGIDAGQTYGLKVISHCGIERYEADMVYKIL